MELNEFFTVYDKQVHDSCPVCKAPFGKGFLRVVRIYWCEDCARLVTYGPYETVPVMTKKAKGSNLDKAYTPYEEDWRIHEYLKKKDLGS